MKKYVLGALLGVAVMGGMAAELARPARMSGTDLAGPIFKGPTVKKVADGNSTALEVDTLTSSDKKFQTGAYQAGPEHQDYNKDGYPEYEFFHVLTGSIKLSDAKGAQVIGPGDSVTIPKGWKGRWDSDGYTKVWVTYDP